MDITFFNPFYNQTCQFNITPSFSNTLNYITPKRSTVPYLRESASTTVSHLKSLTGRVNIFGVTGQVLALTLFSGIAIWLILSRKETNRKKGKV